MAGKGTPYQRYMAARMKMLMRQGASSKEAMPQAVKDWRAIPRRPRNPVFRRDEMVTATGMLTPTGMPAPLRVLRPAPKKGGLFGGLFGTKMYWVEPLEGGRAFQVPVKSMVPMAANPVYPGEIGLSEALGPVKVTRRGPTMGGLLGLGGTETVYVEGPGVPGGAARVPSYTVRPLANPVFACPACRNPVRFKRRSRRCPSCGRGLLLVG